MSESVDTIDLKSAWVRRVLNVEIRHSTLDPADVRGRLNEVGIRLRGMAGTDGYRDLATQFAEAVTALKAGQLETVMQMLDAVEEAMAGGLSAARGQEAQDVIRASRAWQLACEVIAREVPAFKQTVMTLLEAEDEYTPSELEEVNAQLDANLDPILDHIDDSVAEEVTLAINGGGERQAEAMAGLLQRVTEIEAYFTKAEIIGLIDDNGVAPLQVGATALAALAELRQALARRAG